MATITSTANGNWQDGSTWVGGVVPTIADTVLMSHNITMSGVCSCALLTATTTNGRLIVSQLADTEFRYNGLVRFNTGSRFICDLAAYPNINFVSKANYSTGSDDASCQILIDNLGVIQWNGAYRKRVTRAQAAIAASSSGSLSFVVDDATGWKVGDKIGIITTASYQSGADKNAWVVITGISGGPTNATITINSTTTPIAYSKLTRAYVCNYSSNVRQDGTNNKANNILVKLSSGSAVPCTFNNVAFNVSSINYIQTGNGFCVDGAYSAPNSFNGGTFSNNAFELRNQAVALQWNNMYSPVERTDNLYVCSYPAGGVCYGMTSGGGSNMFKIGDEYRAAYFGAMNIYQTPPIGATNYDALFAGQSNGNDTMTTLDMGTKITRLKAWCFYNLSGGNGLASSYTDCEFEQEFAGLVSTGGKLGTGHALNCEVIYNNCMFPASVAGINSNAFMYTPGNRLWLKNKNQDPNQQEAYTLINTGPTFLRDTTLSKRFRGDAAMRITAKTVADAPTQFIEFVAQPGVNYLILGYVMYDNAAGNANPPRITASGKNVTMTGTGVTANTYTCPSGVNTTNKYELTVSHANPNATTITLAQDVRSSSTTAVNAYFDGLIDYPWVQKVRHYGYTFDFRIQRVSNPVTQVNEATASAYTGVTLNYITPTITVGVGTANTFRKVYDYIQSQAVLPSVGFDYDVPMTSTDGNNFVVELTTKVVWPTMGADGTLVGGWLQLSTPGVHSYKLSGTKIEFKAAGTYNMSDTDFSGTCELVNTSGGAVTVSVSGSPSFTNTGPSITITAPAVALTVTGFPTGSDVVILAAGTTTVRDSVDSVVGTSWAYNYAITEAIDIGVILPGYVPYYVRNYSLTGASATLPVTLTPDRNYT